MGTYLEFCGVYYLLVDTSFHGYSFNEAYHTPEFEFIQIISFFFSQISMRGIILEFGFLPYSKLRLTRWWMNGN